MDAVMDAVTTEMLAESIKTGIKHHSAHTEYNHLFHFTREITFAANGYP